MSQPRAGSGIAAPFRHKIQLSSALARERLMEVHFRYALELVDRAQPEVDASRALTIYARLHHVRGEELNLLYHKVFVALGRRGAPKVPAPGAEGQEVPIAADGSQSVLAYLRRRLRGRVNTELREWVEFHTGRAETELLWTHVENALHFVDLLEPAAGVGEAVALYAEALAIPPARAETIYYLVLAHRSAGPAWTEEGEVDEATRVHSGDRDAEPALRSLRIVDARRPPRRRRTG